ncbi:Leu/Phe/Val dehydrogenase [Bacterioplanoides sp.]|uniref:Leu/Phe/Val dehydrogenase n=1 Tax=Bacterioplanoides sp. TaxID=2066072 RepID=UPI003B5B497A
MFKRMQEMQCESVHCFSSVQSSVPFRAFIVLHNSDRGAALGGCRLQPYSNEQAALNDAMRLAQGMSYKAALADIAHGGGKSVIIEPKQPYDRQALFRWFADCVDSLNGRYITAMDAGTQVTDMDLIASRTQHVASHSAIGDPSPFTAQGVLHGIRAALEFRLHKEIRDASVAIQGLGHVGLELARLLMRAGAKVWVTDPNVQACHKAAEMGAEVVELEDIYRLPADVFAPCALGAVINAETLPLLNCKIVAGCANNQLADNAMGDALVARDILYAPDFVINAGGLIYAASRYDQHNADQIERRLQQIYYSLLRLFVAAQSRGCGVHQIAVDQAIETLARDHLKLTA